MLPTEQNGSTIIYAKLVRPYFLKHHECKLFGIYGCIIFNFFIPISSCRQDHQRWHE